MEGDEVIQERDDFMHISTHKSDDSMHIATYMSKTMHPVAYEHIGKVL